MAKKTSICIGGDCSVICEGPCYAIVTEDGCIARCIDKADTRNNRSTKTYR